MQKFINVIAVSSGIVSLAIVVGGVSVYVSRDAIIDGIKSQALEAITGSLGSLGGVGEGSLPLGSNDLVSPTPQASSPTAPLPTSPTF